MLCISITPTWKLVLYHKMACIIKNRVEILFYSFNLCLGISIYALSISIKFCILCFITFNSRLYAWRGIHSRYLCRCCYIISLSPSILLYVSTVQWKVGGITHFYGYVVVTHLIPREGIRFYLLYRLVFLQDVCLLHKVVEVSNICTMFLVDTIYVDLRRKSDVIYIRFSVTFQINCFLSVLFSCALSTAQEIKIPSLTSASLQDIKLGLLEIQHPERPY